MAVSVIAVRALQNPAPFTAPLAFEIEFEASCNLAADVVWRLVYVGSADSDRYDQELENVEVGPVTQGNFRFVLEANPPNPALIPDDDIVGVTVVLLTCSYRGNEFIRVGYYVNNEYLDEELRENPPEKPLIDKLQRSILADHPRVTRYAVPFDEPEPMDGGAQPMDEDMGGAAPAEDQGAAEGGQGAAAGGQDAAYQLPGGFYEAQPAAFGGHGQPAQQLYQPGVAVQ